MAQPAAVLNIIVLANTRTATGQLVALDRTLKGTAARANRRSAAMGASIAKGAKVGALGLAALAGLSVKASVDFESAFAEVRKTVDTSEAGFDRLREGIRNMAKEIPTGADELARIAGVAGQLGIEADGILKFTRTVADLGETTNLAGDEAAKALARIANIMGTAQKDFGRLGSTIVELGNNLATTESEITEMALRIAGAGKQVGLSESQVLSFAGALSSVGVRAQAGGSAISRAFITIAESVNEGGKELDTFAEVAGVSGEKFRRIFERDAARAMVLFVEGLGKMRKEGDDVFGTLDDLGFAEIRLRDALLRASGAGDLFRKSLKLGSEEWKRNTALTEEANKRYNTTSAQFDIFKNRVRDLFIELGDRLTPAIRTMLKEINEGFPRARGAVKRFFETNEDARAFLEAMRNVGEGIRFVIEQVVLPVMRRMLPAFKQNFEGLAKIVRGGVRIIAGILTGDFGKAWDGVQDIFRGGVQIVKGILRLATAPMRELAARIGEGMGDAFSAAWDRIKGIFRSAADIVIGIARRLRDVVVRVFGGLRSAAQKVANAVEDIVDFVRDLINLIPKIPDFPDPPDAPFGLPGGGLLDLIGAGKPVAGLPKHVSGFESTAASFGLTVTSDFRPGDPGFHGLNRARDFAGPAGQMLAFASFMANRFGSGLAELIHTPLGFSIDNGRRVAPFAQADHFDHVHVALRQGTKAFSGGMALLGEAGRELAMLPQGTRVLSNPQTESLLGGSPVHVTLNFADGMGFLAEFVQAEIDGAAPDLVNVVMREGGRNRARARQLPGRAGRS